MSIDEPRPSHSVQHRRRSTSAENAVAPSSRHRQVVGCGMTKGAVGRASSSDRHDYAAIATPVTSAQVVKA